MTNRSEEILQAIENISQKRHVISEKAIEAKNALDNGQLLDHQADYDDEVSELDTIKDFPITDFNKGLRLIRTIIRDTRFDDFSTLLKYPGKLMMIHFFLGLFRGLGFMLGVTVVGLISGYICLNIFPSVAPFLYSILFS
jgi:hypothetical protein